MPYLRWWPVTAMNSSRIRPFSFFALPHPNRYSTKVVASIKTLPKIPEAIAWGRHQQDGKTEVVGISTRPVPDLVQAGRTRAVSWTNSSPLLTAAGCFGNFADGSPVSFAQDADSVQNRLMIEELTELGSR